MARGGVPVGGRGADRALVALALGVLLLGDTSARRERLHRLVADGLAGVLVFDAGPGGPGPVPAAALRSERADLLLASDEEGGAVTRIWRSVGAPVPGPAALGRYDRPAATRALAAWTGRACRAAGIDLVLAPVADVAPPGSTMAGRSFGADPGLVSRHVAATVVGLQDDAGVMSCPKHFPGHGRTTVDSHHSLPRLDGAAGVDEQRLEAELLPPFRAAAAAGAAAMMVGHLWVPLLDGTNPTSLSDRVVRSLRDDLGHHGLVLVDGLGMGALTGVTGPGEAAVRAVLAGADLLCLSARRDDVDVSAEVVTALVDAVRSGRLPEERLAAAGARVKAAAAVAGGRRAHSRADEAGPLPWVATAVARAALEAHGDLRLRRPAVVATADSRGTAATPVPWGVGAGLAAAGLAVRLNAFGPRDTDVVDVVAATAPQHEVVVVLRDAGRQAWQGSMAARILAVRPDAVVVQLGVADHDVRAGRQVRVHDVSAVAVQAVLGRLSCDPRRR